MKRNILILWSLSALAASGCEDKEPRADLMQDTETPDLNPDVSVEAMYSAEQQQQIEDFETARAKFKDMTLDEFQETYGPLGAYRESLTFNPSDASNMDLIDDAYTIQGDARDAFESNGFVVLKDTKYDTFLQGFIDIYTKDLPVYFSADAMLDALHLSFDRMLMDIETSVLSKDLEILLIKMSDALDGTAFSGDESVEQTLDDAAVWVCTAQSLLAGEKQPCLRGRDAVVNAYLKYIAAEKPADVAVFGEVRTEDFSQFKPRGHYTKSEILTHYFQAMMWLQRTGLNFAKYSRHARLAYLLSELVRESGAEDAYSRIDNVIVALVGISDSMNVPELLDVAAGAAVDSLSALKNEETVKNFVDAAIRSGAGAQRINSTFLAADTTLGDDEFTPIPPLYHFMGQRFIVDSYVFTNVVYDRVKNPDRYMASPLDTWMVLGNRETVPLLEKELGTYNYHPNLATLDYLITTYDDAFWTENFYNGWLFALMTLDADVSGDTYPEVMQTRDWQRRMLQAQLGSWAHLRHDTLLYAKPAYDMNACEYPDAWVDAYPDFFERVADMADNAGTTLDSLGIFDVSETTDDHYFYGSALERYFARLSEVSLMLKDIADAEMQRVRLSDVQLEFMNQLIYQEGMCGMPPYSGWYSEILYKFTEDNMETFDPTVADVYTEVNSGEVLHVATGNSNLMVLSVTTDCQNRAYVGPVLSYHEKITENFERLDDETWKGMLEAGEESRPAWTESFVR